jgi:hypothetical protein
MKELKRRKYTNEYGVTYTNRLVEEYHYGERYFCWYQDCTQPNGKTSTTQFAHYKQMKRMNDVMEKYNF